METVFVYYENSMFGIVQFVEFHCKSRSCAILLSLAFILYQQDFYDQILSDMSQIGIVSEWKEALYVEFLFMKKASFIKNLEGLILLNYFTAVEKRNLFIC